MDRSNWKADESNRFAKKDGSDPEIAVHEMSTEVKPWIVKVNQKKSDQPRKTCCAIF